MGEKLKKIIKDIFEGLIELIYPIEDRCIICKDDSSYGICKNCLNKIRKIPAKDQDDIISYGYYGGILKELILKFKYKGDFTAGNILAELLSEYIVNNIEYKNYVITYVPLSKKSKRKRGFNQCKYIADYISESLSIRCVEVIVKNKETKEQKHLNREERKVNLKDAFTITNKFNVKNLNIILIDDITTTGFTLRECCRILKKNGINDIKLLTLAKSHI